MFPVPKLPGEQIEAADVTVGGHIYLSNYRIVITEDTEGGVAAIPLVSVELVEAKGINGLQITCKHGRVYK